MSKLRLVILDAFMNASIVTLLGGIILLGVINTSDLFLVSVKETGCARTERSDVLSCRKIEFKGRNLLGKKRFSYRMEGNQIEGGPKDFIVVRPSKPSFCRKVAKKSGDQICLLITKKDYAGYFPTGPGGRVINPAIIRDFFPITTSSSDIGDGRDWADVKPLFLPEEDKKQGTPQP